MPTDSKMIRIGDVNTGPAPYMTEADLAHSRRSDAVFTDTDIAASWYSGAD